MAGLRPTNPPPFSQQFLRGRLDYDPDTGMLTWKPLPFGARDWRRFNTVFAGQRAGSEPTGRGTDLYRKVRLQGKGYYEHRIVWLLVHGEWPEKHIDHINGRKTDNRLTNLRLVLPAENSANTTVGWGASKYRGVSFRKARGTWRAAIMVNGKRCFLEGFRCETAAAIARDRKALDLAGPYVRLNIKG